MSSTRKDFGDPVQLIVAITSDGQRTKVGCVYAWNNGEETHHFVHEIPFGARLQIEPIEPDAEGSGTNDDPQNS